MRTYTCANRNAETCVPMYVCMYHVHHRYKCDEDAYVCTYMCCLQPCLPTYFIFHTSVRVLESWMPVRPCVVNSIAFVSLALRRRPFGKEFIANETIRTIINTKCEVNNLRFSSWVHKVDFPTTKKPPIENVFKLFKSKSCILTLSWGKVMSTRHRHLSGTHKQKVGS